MRAGEVMMWRWKRRAALEDNQQMADKFILHLISRRRVGRAGGPNESTPPPDATACLSNSLIDAIKEISKGFSSGLFPEAALVRHQNGGKKERYNQNSLEGED